jgi:hypothetical protein
MFNKSPSPIFGKTKLAFSLMNALLPNAEFTGVAGRCGFNTAEAHLKMEQYFHCPLIHFHHKTIEGRWAHSNISSPAPSAESLSPFHRQNSECLNKVFLFTLGFLILINYSNTNPENQDGQVRNLLE